MENKTTIKIEDGIILTSEQSRLIFSFIDYCYRALKLNDMYTIQLVADRKKHNIGTTAVCISSKKEVLIFSKGRLLADVLRSIGHEMTHLKQHENGEHPDSKYLHFSSPLEDGANEVAGKLLNAYVEVMGNKTIYEEYIQAV